MNKDLKKHIYSLHPLEKCVIQYLIDSTSVEDISKNSGLSIAESTAALQLLEQKEYLTLTKEENTKIVLDVFGERFVEEDLPEIQVLMMMRFQ